MRTIGILPSTCQPPHKGHFKAYELLKRAAGPDTYVVTTDYDPSIEAPIHFGDKEQILVRHGIDDSHIKKVKNLNTSWEVLNNYDPLTTIVIYGLNARDAQKKISSPSKYYEYLLGAQGHLRPYKQRAYILIIDDNLREKSKIGTLKVYTSQNVREALGSHRFTNEQKQKWFKKFFGWFDLGLFELLKNKYTNAHQSADGIESDMPDIKEELKKEICKILNELMGSPPSIAADSSYGPESVATDTLQEPQDIQPSMPDLVKAKKTAIDQKDTNIKQYDRDKTAVRNYLQNTKKTDVEKVKKAEKDIAQAGRTKQTTSTIAQSTI